MEASPAPKKTAEGTFTGIQGGRAGRALKKAGRKAKKYIREGEKTRVVKGGDDAWGRHLGPRGEKGAARWQVIKADGAIPIQNWGEKTKPGFLERP